MCRSCYRLLAVPPSRCRVNWREAFHRPANRPFRTPPALLSAHSFGFSLPVPHLPLEKVPSSAARAAPAAPASATCRRSTSSMRVCQPGPVARKCSITSGERRTDYCALAPLPEGRRPRRVNAPRSVRKPSSRLIEAGQVPAPAGVSSLSPPRKRRGSSRSVRSSPRCLPKSSLETAAVAKLRAERPHAGLAITAEK